MFSTGYFVVTQTYPSFDRRRKKDYNLEVVKDFWLIKNGRDILGDVFVFEREDAARRLYQFKCTTGESYGSQTNMRFIRARTRKGAARSGMDDSGEILEYFQPTFEQAQEYARIARQRTIQAHREDVAMYRSVIEMAHTRFPKIDRSAIPRAREDDPQREVFELGDYAVSLYRCGALTEAEIHAAQKSSKSGYSDYRYAEDHYQLVLLPND